MSEINKEGTEAPSENILANKKVRYGGTLILGLITGVLIGAALGGPLSGFLVL